MSMRSMGMYLCVLSNLNHLPYPRGALFAPLEISLEGITLDSSNIEPYVWLWSPSRLEYGPCMGVFLI